MGTYVYWFVWLVGWLFITLFIGAYVEVVDPRNFRERNYTFFGLHIQTDVTNRKHGEATKNENLFIPTTLVESVEGDNVF